jgi:hypothetical protein
VNDSTQIYDFNPGFGPKVSNVDSGNGFGTRVFWTAVIPDSDVQVNPAAGTATLDVSNLAEVNYFSRKGGAGIISLGPDWQTAGVDATVSFHVAWRSPITRRVEIRDAADGFAGTFNEVNNNNVTVSWSGSNALGFSFTSNVGNLATSTALAPGNFFAQLAEERNGIYFPAGGNPGAHSPGSRDVVVQPTIGQSNASAPSSALFGEQPAQPAALPLPGLAPQGSDLTSGHLTQPPSGPNGMDIRAAHPGVLNPVFADLESSSLWDAFHGADGPA